MVCTIITEYTNTRTRAQLIDAIKKSADASPVIVIDVRWSTKYPMNGQFYPEVLKEALGSHSMDYMYCKNLGNPFKNLPDVLEMRRKYEERTTIQPEFAELVQMAREWTGMICLLCYCQPPRPCHRFWLRDMVQRAIRDGIG